jgi:hypothetical protein
MMSQKNQKPHRNLIAWQKGMDLVSEIYKLTQDRPTSAFTARCLQLTAH